MRSDEMPQSQQGRVSVQNRVPLYWGLGALALLAVGVTVFFLVTNDPGETPADTSRMDSQVNPHLDSTAQSGAGASADSGDKEPGRPARRIKEQPNVGGVPDTKGPVGPLPDACVGVPETPLYTSSEDGEQTGKLKLGQRLRILAVQGQRLQVRMSDGSEAWAKRRDLCTPTELERRKNSGQVPDSVISLIYNKTRGRFALSDGPLKIRNDTAVIHAGQAYWMDESAENRSFKIASVPCVGDPDVLLLVSGTGRVHRLPIWSHAGNATQADTPVRNHTPDKNSGNGNSSKNILTLHNGVTMKLVRIEAGRFMTGSNKGGVQASPVRQVTLPKPFYMGTTEVTQAQWQAVLGDLQPWKTPAGLGLNEYLAKAGADNAVSYVSWDDVMFFCQRLSKKTGRTVRLPTEAEWEYACRAGTTTAYSFGDDASKLGDYAWYKGNAWDKDEKYAHPVGRKKPNAWGLYDMHGNVCEWCEWDADSYASADARSPKGTGSNERNRVIRGGSWASGPIECRAAARARSYPHAMPFIGFRVVVSIPDGKQSQADVAFAALMDEAGQIVARMPLDSTHLSLAQKAELARALSAVRLALIHKPTDRQALALKGWIDAMLQNGKALALTLGTGVTMKLLRVEAGTFTMGSPVTEKARIKTEGPQRQVTLTKPFYVGLHEITQAQWKAVMGTEPWRGKKCTRYGPDLAASYISWNDATAFCKALSKKTGRTVRLPTEAEWEYACRAGTTTAYSFGDDASKLGDYAWYDGNTYNKGKKYTHAVGVKKPNAWGLYDMHGNAWEWCADWYADSYASTDTRNPKGPASGDIRVLRGGTWFFDPLQCRTAARYGGYPAKSDLFIGFRVVVSSGRAD